MKSSQFSHCVFYFKKMYVRRGVHRIVPQARYLRSGPSIFQMLKKATENNNNNEQKKESNYASASSLMDILNTAPKDENSLKKEEKVEVEEKPGEKNQKDVFSKLRSLLDMNDEPVQEKNNIAQKMQSLVESMRDYRAKIDPNTLEDDEDGGKKVKTKVKRPKNLFGVEISFESSTLYESQFMKKDETPIFQPDYNESSNLLTDFKNEKDIFKSSWDRLIYLDQRAPPVKFMKLSNKKKIRLPRVLKLEHAFLEMLVRTELMEREGDDYKAIKILPSMPAKEVSKALGVSEYDLRQIVLALGRSIHPVESFNMLAREVEEVCKYLDHPYEFIEFKKADVKPVTYKSGIERPPVVTVMGHVNHGKTTLLDTFRKKKMAPIEVGGITQSVGSFTAKFKGKYPVTFFDTPGHSVFSSVRKNVAKVTDLIIIIVAANEGLQSQTLDSIKTAQAYGIPILVALNKCDLLGNDADAQVLSIKEQLAGAGVELEEMGGEVQVVKISAKTGFGLDELEDSILLAAEMLELKAPVDVPAQALIVETRTEPGKGHIALAVVKHGVLKQKDNIVCGEFKGVVRNMFDWDGNPVKEAGPSIPVLIKGLEGDPSVGDYINVVENAKKAKDVVYVRQTNNVQDDTQLPTEAVSTEESGDSSRKELNVIVKANLSGSLQSLLDYLSRVRFHCFCQNNLQFLDTKHRCMLQNNKIVCRRDILARFRISKAK
jgi:small GTP-binding protein